MSNFFHKIKTGVRPVEKSVAPRLSLAAFGKHPGWDDHIPGIGVETDALAYVKQTLYVSGVGKQIDSGAWEKLEPGKRLEGFDHIFLWTRPGHVLLGELWSSTDGKGRAKYPMVVCVDGEGITPDFLLARAQPDLVRLRAACQATAAADQVTALCRSSQEQLRNALSPGGFSAAESGPVTAARRQFLDNREFMPDRLGLMRVLHELGGASGHSRHLRVPLASDSPSEAMPLWCEFFRQVVSPSTPVLLISHRGADWLDVLIGEPDGADFFCLQAALKAMPLTTEIPYELPPELKRRWKEVEARFMGLAVPPAKEAAPSTPPRVIIEQPDPPPPATTPGKRNWILPVIVGLALLAGVLGYLIYKGRPTATSSTPEPASGIVAKPEAPGNPPVAISNSAPGAATLTPPKTSAVSPAAELSQQQYNAAMTDARAALGKQNYAEASAKTDVALGLKPNDPAAASLKRDAVAHQQELAGQSAQLKQYTQAFAAGQAAYGKNDFTTAVAQAEMALTIKTNDPAAAKLRADAMSQLDLAAIAAGERQTKYETAMKAASAAVVLKNYAEAIKQADTALAKLPGDAAATKLKGDAQKAQAEMVAQAERDKKYETAMAAGQKAYGAKEYAEAIKQADAARSNRVADAAALRLKSDAQTQLDEIAAQAERDKKYNSAMAAGQSAYDRKDYAEAITQVDAALAIRSGDAEATALKQKAADDRDLQDAQASFDRGDLEKAKSLCAAHAGTLAFDDLAKRLVAKAADKYDTELEVYLVRFGRLDPKNAKTPEARRETLWLGELPIQQRDQCQRDVELLREAFNASGRLDPDRDKKLSDLKKAIDQHL